MPRKPDIPVDPAELRRRAEALLRDQRKVHPSKAGDQKSGADSLRALHELEVHQIELEMQNAELQQARNELETSLEKYTDLYDFAPVGYLTLDPEGIIHESNLTGASLLGIARSLLVKQRLVFFVAPDDRLIFDSFLQQAFASKVLQVCEVTLKVEGQLPIEVELEAIAAESGRACRVTLTDITDRRRNEADRLVLNKLESTGILAGGLAHDFNNLLTTLLLNLGLAQERVPPASAPLLAEAMKAAETARGLTQQLITFAKGGAPVRKLTSLSALIQDSIRSALSGSRVRCEFSLADNLWPAEVDAGQIGQVIRNLVLNAREAMPEGGVLSVQAENVASASDGERTLPPGDYVRVRIADQGGGISKEMLPKIFDPYFSTKQRGEQKGMGLGLTICHAIIQKHSGAITVESREGIGATFCFYLPASHKLPESEKASESKTVPQHAKILVMDDEDGMRKVIGVLLQRMGHEAELVANGERAIEVYGQAKDQRLPFDAVILDLTIRGGMGGQETILALRKLDPAAKAIVMSGYAEDPVVLEPERHGFEAALAKPFDGTELQEALSQVLGS